MALWVCSHCTTKFAVGVPHCPQCGNADYYEEGSMPKISRHGGPTYVGDIAEPVAEETAVESVDVESAAEEPEPVSPYDGMLRADLQAELDRRGLPTSGNKPELIARLVAADGIDEAVEPEESAEE